MTKMYNDEPSFGGFSPDNLREAIIRDCLSSGDPVNYLYVLLDVIRDIEDEWNEFLETEDALEDKFWGEFADEIGWGGEK